MSCQNSTMSLTRAGTRTARSGDKRTNREATTCPILFLLRHVYNLLEEKRLILRVKSLLPLRIRNNDRTQTARSPDHPQTDHLKGGGGGGKHE